LLPTAFTRTGRARILSTASPNRGSSATATAAFPRTLKPYWNLPAVPNYA
jgi:hypothetical protein